MSDLSLEQYAFVTAALSEGYTRSEILDRLGLSEDAWEDAEERWVERLQESAEDDLALYDDLDRALAKERARFARKVAPLDSDIVAYLCFQRHASTASNLPAFLRDHGLFLGDWVRLQEAWAERLVEDGELRVAAAAALADEAPHTLATISPDPRVWPADAAKVRVITAVEDEPTVELSEWGLSGLRGAPPAAAVASSPIPEARETAPSSVPPPPPTLDPLRGVEARLPSFLRRPLEAPQAPGFGRTIAHVVDRSLEEALAASLPFRAPSAPPAASSEEGDTLPGTSPGIDLPFRPAPKPGSAELTLEQYASLSAELAAFPGEAETILRRHGLADADAMSSLEVRWQERLMQNAAEFEEWQAFYERYHAEWTAKASRRRPGR
jgi:hypothetical protein